MTSMALTLRDVESAIAPCPPTVSANTPLMAAISLMGGQHDCILVVADPLVAIPHAELTGGGLLVGIVTAQDVVRGVAAGLPGLENPVAAAMTHPVISVQRSAIASGDRLWRAFQQCGVSHLPILDDGGQILGIVTQQSLINAVRLPEETLPEGVLPEEPSPAGALNRNESTYRTLLQAMPDLLLRTRCNGTDIEVLSPGNVKEFLVAEDADNPEGYRTLPSEVVARKRRYIQQAVETQQLQVFEQQIDIAGELRHEEVRVAALEDDEALVIIRDITDRKSLEFALCESESRLSDIVNSTAAAISRVRFFANYTWEYEFCSASYEGVFGYSGSEFMADPELWRSRLFAADGPEIEASMADILAGQSRTVEYRFHHKDGRLIWIFASFTSRRDAATDCWIVTAMSQDISDRKATEAALRTNEGKSRAILATIPDLMFRLSATGEYLEYFGNRHELDIVCKGQNPTGRLMTEILSPELAQRQMACIQEVLATRQLMVYEQEVQVGDRWQYEEVRVAPSGEQEVLFIIRDIGERKRAEITLRQQAERDRLLARLTQQMRQSLELDQILSTTVTEVRHLLEADRVLIYRFNADWGGEMIVESVRDPWVTALGTNLRDPCFGDDLVDQYRQGRISQIADLHHSGLSPCHVELLAQFQVQASLAVPITCDGKLWGLLCVHQCQATRVWQPEEVGLLIQLTGQLAIALQQAGLYQQVQRLNTDLERQVNERTAALQVSEARFRSIFEQSPLGIVITNPEGRLLTLNSQACQITGYSEAERLGGHYLDHVHPEDRPAATALFQQVLQGTQSQGTLESRYLTKAGAVIWLEVTRAVIRDAQGQPSALVGMIQDITERKGLELSLQRSEAKLNHVLNTVIAAICNFRVYPDGTWEYNYYSPGFEDLLGYTPADLTAHKHLWRSRVVAADRKAVIQPLYEKILQGECTIRYEYRAYHRDGRLRWIAATLTSGWDAAANCWMVTTVDTDISDRKRLEAERLQAQEELQAQKDFLQQVMESVPSGIFVKDAALRIQMSNQAMAELYGLPIPDLLGRRSLEVDSHLDAGQRVAFHQEDLEVIQTGKTLVKQDRFVRPNGQVRWYQTTLKPFLDAQGQPQGLIGNAVEITDRKQAEMALAKSEARYRAIVEDQTEIICRFLPDGRLRFVNEAFCRYFGVEREDAIGQPYQPRIFAADQAYVAQQIQSMSSTNPVILVENRVVARGEVRWTQWNNRMLFDPEGQLLEYQAVGRDITAAKAAEVALQQSQQQYRNLVNSIDAVVWEGDPLTWQFTFVSQQAERLLGYPLTVWQSPNFWYDYTHPDDRERVREFCSRNIQRQQDHTLEFRMLAADGGIVWIRNTTNVIVDNGQTQKLQGLVIDISDRKAAELALKESEIRFRCLTENVPGMIYRDHLRLEGDDMIEAFSYASPRCEEILGITVETLMQGGGTIWHLIHPEDVVGLREDMIQCVRHRWPTFWSEYRIITPSGQQKWLQDRAQATFLDNGDVIWDGLIEDISDRKAVELALHQRMEREQILGEITRHIRESLDLSQILETAVTEARQIFQADRALIFRLTPSGVGVVIQESVLPAYPTTAAMHFPDECFPPACYAHYCQGQPRIVPDVTQDEWAGCLQTFMQSVGVQSKLVAPIVQRDEHDQPVVWGLLILHACGDRRQWQPAEAEFLQQISNQMAIAIHQSELYHQLQNTNSHLARATRLKDEFLANMSHELRTPLNAILGLSEALQSHAFGPINPKQQQFLTTIQSSGHHLLSLINDILDLAKMEAGKLDLMMHPVAIQHLCQSSLVMVEQQALQKGVRLIVSLDPSLGHIEVDELRIRQVLVNLLNNAVKFTATGGAVSLTVSPHPPVGPPGIMPDNAASSPSPHNLAPSIYAPLSYVPQDQTHYLYFAIEDTGIGIAPEDLGKLFQTFVQLDSGLARHYEGTGLGLVLVQRIVHLHGGQVTVASVLGQGSRFTVALPRRQRGIAPDIQEPERQQGEAAKTWVPGPASQPSSPLILLAEDNPANAHMVCSYLEGRGYRLLLAADGQEAIALTQRHQPELILMDIQMPGMDGLTAIRHLRQDPQSATVPIIAMTALAMSGDRERCLETGASAYVSKPVSLKQLVETIQRLLNSVRPI